MNTAQLLTIIGPDARNEIVCDRYGDASLHAGGYILADPCYILNEPDDRSAYEEFLKEKYRQLTVRSPDEKWQTMTFRGQTIYHRNTDGDGCHFGHCVDSGQLVAIPLSICNRQTRTVFADS